MPVATARSDAATSAALAAGGGGHFDTSANTTANLSSIVPATLPSSPSTTIKSKGTLAGASTITSTSSGGKKSVGSPPGELKFSEWFWSAIYLATGFDLNVIGTIKRGKHDTYGIPERHLGDEVKWTSPEVLEALRKHITDHMENLHTLNSMKEERKQNLSLRFEYGNKTTYEAVSGRVKGSIPTEDFFYNFFTDLNCQKCGISELDPTFASLVNLEKISLTCNNIRVLENLPVGLQVLSACGNKIEEVGNLCRNKALRHLGLAHNCLSSLVHLVPRVVYVKAPPNIYDRDSLLPPIPPPKLAGTDAALDYLINLVSLDLAFNEFSDIYTVVQSLLLLPNLQLLVLQGNPLALVPRYRQYVAKYMPKLQSLDDINFTEEEREAVNRVKDEEFAPSVPEMSTVTLDVTISDISGLRTDPDAPARVESAVPLDGKAKKKDAVRKPDKKPGSQEGKKKGKTVDPDTLKPIIERRTFVRIKAEIAGIEVLSAEVPKNPVVITEAMQQQMAAADSAAAAAAATPATPQTRIVPQPDPFPINIAHSQKLSFPPTLEVRNALLHPISFVVYEIFRVKTTIPAHPEGDTEVPEAVSVEDTVTKMGKCMASFASLLNTDSKKTNQAPMQPNEAVHMDHVCEEKKKAEIQAKEEARKKAEELARLQMQMQQEEADAASVAADDKRSSKDKRKSVMVKGGKPPAAPMTARGEKKKSLAASSSKKSLAGSLLSEEGPPPEPVVDRYVNPSSLTVSLNVTMEINAKPPPPPPEPEPVQTDKKRKSVFGKKK